MGVQADDSHSDLENGEDEGTTDDQIQIQKEE